MSASSASINNTDTKASSSRLPVKKRQLAEASPPQQPKQEQPTQSQQQQRNSTNHHKPVVVAPAAAMQVQMTTVLSIHHGAGGSNSNSINSNVAAGHHRSYHHQKTKSFTVVQDGGATSAPPPKKMPLLSSSSTALAVVKGPSSSKTKSTTAFLGQLKQQQKFVPSNKIPNQDQLNGILGLGATGAGDDAVFSKAAAQLQRGGGEWLVGSDGRGSDGGRQEYHTHPNQKKYPLPPPFNAAQSLARLGLQPPHSAVAQALASAHKTTSSPFGLPLLSTQQKEALGHTAPPIVSSSTTPSPPPATTSTTSSDNETNKQVDKKKKQEEEKRFKRWTPKEDQILKMAAEKDEGPPHNWKKISTDYFNETRSPQQCKTRWKNALSPEINRDPFSAAEDKIIIEHHKKGFRWPDIAPLLKGRTSEQIRERFVNNIDPSIKTTQWTEEEDEILSVQQRLKGNKWMEIRKYLPGRSEKAIKNRWHNRKTKQRRALRRMAAGKGYCAPGMESPPFGFPDGANVKLESPPPAVAPLPGATPTNPTSISQSNMTATTPALVSESAPVQQRSSLPPTHDDGANHHIKEEDVENRAEL